MCGSHVMRFIAVGGHISTTISMRLRLNSTIVLSPPVTLWPFVERRGELPATSKKLLRHLNTPSNIACTRRRAGVIGRRAAGDA